MDTNTLTNKIIMIENMLKFENRCKRGLIWGEIFNIPCIINHRHDQDLDWNGEIIEEYEINRMFTIDFDFVDQYVYRNTYRNKLSLPDKKSNDELGLTSKYLMVQDHMFSQCLSEAFEKHPYLEFIHCDGTDKTIGFIINIKVCPGSIYLDTVIHEIFNIIAPIFDIEWNRVEKVDVGNYRLPNNVRHVVPKLSETYKLALWDALFKGNKERTQHMYKIWDEHDEMFNSVSFIGGGMRSNRPPFCS